MHSTHAQRDCSMGSELNCPSSWWVAFGVKGRCCNYINVSACIIDANIFMAHLYVFVSHRKNLISVCVCSLKASHETHSLTHKSKNALLINRPIGTWRIKRMHP